MCPVKPELVIFDLDGTLVDSRLDLATAVNRTLVDLGRASLPLEHIVTFIGHGMDRLLERALGDSELLDEARPVFKRHYSLALLDHTLPYPGVDVLVRDLGVERKLAVATNKPGPWARSIVAGLGWSESIPYVVGGADVARLKPAPDMVELLLEQSGCSRTDTVIVGDMEVDVETASAAGLPSVGVSWGLAGRDRLQTSGARWIVDSAVELQVLLDEISI